MSACRTLQIAPERQDPDAAPAAADAAVVVVVVVVVVAQVVCRLQGDYGQSQQHH